MIKIRPYIEEESGVKYISVETHKEGKIVEQSFEYTDQDKVSIIVALIEKAVNDVIDHDPSR